MRQEKFLSNEYYHIYNRGNSKSEIFHDQEDYTRFVKLLYLCNSSKRINYRDDIVKRKIDAYDFDIGKKYVEVLSYVLMPNHFHICLTPTALNLVEGYKDESGNVFKFMLKLTGSYSRYYNKKYKRTGDLFEGTFKAKHVVGTEQLKYLFSYLHLNPVKLIEPKWREKGINDKSKIINFLKKYEYSSLFDYFDSSGREQGCGKILNKNLYLKMLNSQEKQIWDEMFDWLSFDSALN